MQTKGIYDYQGRVIGQLLEELMKHNDYDETLYKLLDKAQERATDIYSGEEKESNEINNYYFEI